MSSCWITRGGWFQKHRSPMTHIFVGGIPTRCGPPPEGRCGSHWGAYTTCCYGVDGVGGQWPVVDATLLLSWLALPHTRQSPHHAVTYDNDSFLRGRKVHLPPTYLALNQCKGSLSAFFFPRFEGNEGRTLLACSLVRGHNLGSLGSAGQDLQSSKSHQHVLLSAIFHWDPKTSGNLGAF